MTSGCPTFFCLQIYSWKARKTEGLKEDEMIASDARRAQAIVPTIERDAR
jgi:hypothetical protein